MAKRQNKIKRWLKRISLWDIVMFIRDIFKRILTILNKGLFYAKWLLFHISRFIWIGLKLIFQYLWVVICFIPTGIMWIFMIVKQIVLFLSASVMIPFTILAWIVSFGQNDEQPIEVGVVDEL